MSKNASRLLFFIFYFLFSGIAAIYLASRMRSARSLQRYKIVQGVCKFFPAFFLGKESFFRNWPVISIILYIFVRMKLPIGIQDFEKIRVGGYLYIDKTEQVYRQQAVARRVPRHAERVLRRAEVDGRMHQVCHAHGSDEVWKGQRASSA